MPQTHDIGSWYFHLLRYDVRPPWKDWAVTEEVEPPYRQGRGVALRVGPRTVLVLGRWHETARDEDDGLLAALRATVLDDVTVDEIREWDGGVRQQENEEGNPDVDRQEDCSPGHPRIYSLD